MMGGILVQGKQKILTCFYDQRLGGGAIPKFVKDVRGFSADMPHPGDLSSKIPVKFKNPIPPTRRPTRRPTDGRLSVDRQSADALAAV